MQNENLAGKGRILIVDDKPHNLRLLSKMLVDQDYEVQTVENSLHALQSAKQMFPDLILLDIMMPNLDGYEVCTQLKADERTRDIPVVFLSALDHSSDKVSAFKAGGVDYITKPFKLQEVLARVQTHLALRELQRRLMDANNALATRLDELAEANAELQARNEDLDAFAHTVAHDLKNPLGLVTGYAELLCIDSDTVTPESLRLHAQKIMRGAEKMKSIINNLLLLASARRMEVEAQPLNMAEIVSDALERLSALIAQHHAEVILPETWPVAMGYAPWVEEVWANYLSNAMKYGGDAKNDIPPRIEVGFDDHASSASHFCFWVQDNGPGLTSEAQLALFTPFERLEQVGIKGHGLGLSIVRRIVERLDGEVGVVSDLGQGSRFYFTLPKAVVD